MKGKIGWLLAAALLVVFLLTGCQGQKEGTPTGKKIARPEGSRPVRVGVVLSFPRGDKGTSDGVIAGLTKAQDELGIEFRVIEPGQLVDEEEALRYLAENNYDLVIGVGYKTVKPLRRVAPEYPDINFALVDEELAQPNVISLRFREEEGSFLAGVMAALLTRSGTVGFIGGADMDLIRRYERGFRQGVEYVNGTDAKKAKVLVNYAGVTEDAFNDPLLGENHARQQVEAGADVIYHAARNTSAGIIKVAREKRRLVIGSDVNQNEEAPGTVTASMVKRVDVMVYRTVEKLCKGELERGATLSFGLAEGGVDLVPAAGVPEGVWRRIEETKGKIVKGEIKVQAQG
ncbi:MAG: basic rane protein [Eubacteriales bacterium]|nr:basic rane protein [Eubacteriales bacterium]MDN5363748.1 basic rane protein [Eubacteriales bacterium]